MVFLQVSKFHINNIMEISLVAQWIRLHASNAVGLGSIPGEGTRSHMHAATRSSPATTKEPACCN